MQRTKTSCSEMYGIWMTTYHKIQTLESELLKSKHKIAQLRSQIPKQKKKKKEEGGGEKGPGDNWLMN